MKDWKDNSYHKKQRRHRNKTNTLSIKILINYLATKQGERKVREKKGGDHQ